MSQLLGWAYFLCWTVSFYPQVCAANLFIDSLDHPKLPKEVCCGTQRRFPSAQCTSRSELSNGKILGFTFYAVYNILFYSSGEIHKEYHRRHPQSTRGPLVQVNDVFFAVHAAVISTFTLSQVYCWGYTRSPRQFPSPWTWGIIIGSGLAIGILSSLVLATQGKHTAWIDVCYAMSYVKLICTFVKYVPQVNRI